MNYIDLESIREPIWLGKQGRHISIASWKITQPDAMYRFGISWKNKEDVQRYPKKFVMRGRDIQSYEAKPLKNYPDSYTHWIPLKDLQEETNDKDICIPHNAIKLPSGECWMEIV